jgi:hypothetical protein
VRRPVTGYNSIARLPLTAGLTAIGVVASYYTGNAAARADDDSKDIEEILRKGGI